MSQENYFFSPPLHWFPPHSFLPTPAIPPVNDLTLASYEASSVSTDVNATQSSTKRDYDKWAKEEEKFLVNLWASSLEKLESQQARKEWQAITKALNEKFNISCTVPQVMRKLKHLKDKYKDAKEWNLRQTGANRKTSPYYESFDSVLGCRDIVTMQYVRETAQGEATSSEKRKKTSSDEALEKLSSTEDKEESQAEKSSIDSPDVRDEEIDNAFKALRINAKAKAHVKACTERKKEERK